MWRPNYITRETTEYILIHSTGSDDDEGVYELDRKRRGKFQYDCGYHYVIRRSGLVETGRDITAPSGFPPKNSSVAICLAGSEEITPEQALSLRSLIARLAEEYPDAYVYPKCKLTNFKFEGEIDNESNFRNATGESPTGVSGSSPSE